MAEGDAGAFGLELFTLVLLLVGFVDDGSGSDVTLLVLLSCFVSVF